MQQLRLLYDLVDIIYPDTCMGCERPLVHNENLICLHCLDELPKTAFHRIPENAVVQLFTGRCYLDKATSWLHFSKGGIVQSMMHQFKYKGRKDVGAKLAKMMAKDLVQDGFFNDIDLLVPVPLHPRKLKKRGFNQSEVLTATLSEITEIPVSADNLIRAVFNKTQTRKSRFDRWLNVKTVFGVKEPDIFRRKHILLVDDVVTTGSTIEAAVLKLEEIKGVKTSLLTLAKA